MSVLRLEPPIDAASGELLRLNGRRARVLQLLDEATLVAALEPGLDAQPARIERLGMADARWRCGALGHRARYWVTGLTYLDVLMPQRQASVTLLESPHQAETLLLDWAQGLVADGATVIWCHIGAPQARALRLQRALDGVDGVELIARAASNPVYLRAAAPRDAMRRADARAAAGEDVVVIVDTVAQACAAQRELNQALVDQGGLSDPRPQPWLDGALDRVGAYEDTGSIGVLLVSGAGPIALWRRRALDHLVVTSGLYPPLAIARAHIERWRGYDLRRLIGMLGAREAAALRRGLAQTPGRRRDLAQSLAMAAWLARGGAPQDSEVRARELLAQRPELAETLRRRRLREGSALSWP